MIAGIFDFFTGGSSSSSSSDKSYENYIVPIVQHAGRELTYADCFAWLNRRVVLQLKKFERPQLGTIKYIGSDARGILCAGIEFDYDIAGMSGKVRGQKLFKCKPNHGLLVPVEYVCFLEDHENGTNIFPVREVTQNTLAPSAPANINRTQSVPNLLSGGVNNVPLKDYISQTLPTLKIGENVVWLGGSNPQTGIVKWIGKAGRSKDVPIKAWVEMDDYMGYGLNEMDVGTKFGCAAGRGKFLPVDELILLENFIPGGGEGEGDADRQSERLPDSIQDFSANIPNKVEASSATETDSSGDLIDLAQQEGETTTDVTLSQGDNNMRLKNERSPTNLEPSVTNAVDSETGTQSTLPDALAEIIREFSPLNSSPVKPVESNSSSQVESPDSSPTVGSEHRNTESGASESSGPSPSHSKSDLNGNFSSPKKVTVDETDNSALQSPDVDYLPPFIVPPINIVEFFKADGMKGIQGRRNSCYIDVVLFSMFAFTDTFDPYFLVKYTFNSKGPDSEVTRTAKKALAEQVVNPLRQNYYCPAVGVNFLRELMIPFSDKLDGAFMDIEEFMLILFEKVFNLKEFITYDNGMKDYLHQVNLGDHNLPSVMTMKQCLELSMADYGLKLQGVPSPAFIINIPRNSYGIIQSTIIVPTLRLTLDTVMKQKENQDLLSSRPSIVMNLLAVICIKDFHFVTFVKCGSGPLSHWVLFDSNPSEERPKAEIVPNMGEWLESLEHQCLTNPSAVASNKHKFPPMVQKLLSDIYVCIYCPILD